MSDDSIDYNARFEACASLYQKATGYLRPGKDAVHYDTMSDENVARFTKWRDEQGWGDALDHIASLQRDIERVTGELAEMTADRDSWRKQAGDRVDDALAFSARAEQAERERDAIRELMNTYNLGGWTDAIAPMRRALQAERERDEAVAWIRVIGEEAVLAGAMSGDRDATLANIRALRRDLAAARQDAEIYRNAINAVLCHEHTTIAIRHAIGAAIDAARKEGT